MKAEAIVGLAVGVTILAGFLWRLLRAIHNGVNVVEDSRRDIAGLKDDVGSLHASLNNGIRVDIRSASEQAKKAQQLAGEAAKAASVADQHATEGREEIRRSVNALRAEVDIYTNVVLTDRARIKAALRELGYDIADDE